MSQETGAHALPASPSPPESPEIPLAEVESPWPEPIPTRVGGLLYLVNVILRLNLHTEEITPWSLLEALGYALLRGDLKDDPLWGVLADLAGRDPQEPLPELPHGMAEQVQDWLRAALPGVAEPERYLLLVDGHLYVTATHLDLVMDLDRIRLEVRLAGLDADPGWAPDFGRVIRFHFV